MSWTFLFPNAFVIQNLQKPRVVTSLVYAHSLGLDKVISDTKTDHEMKLNGKTVAPAPVYPDVLILVDIKNKN